MILSKQILKNSMKGLKISGIIGLGTLVITGGLVHNTLYATTITPTTYNISELTSTLYRTVPNGYTKPPYKFTIDPESTNPTTNELSSTDAAEIISQEIYRYFKVTISGKVIELIHSPADKDDKPHWSSSVDIDSNCRIYVNIDSVTGEVNSFRRSSKSSNHLIANPSKDPKIMEKQVDATAADLIKVIDSNAKANSKKIQDLIASSGFIPETIKSVTYNRCGVAIYYEPTRITLEPAFKVVTTSGNIYLITLSEDFTSIEGLRLLKPVATSDTSKLTPLLLAD